METIKVFILVALYVILALIVLGFIGQALDTISKRDDEEENEDNN